MKYRCEIGRDVQRLHQVARSKISATAGQPEADAVSRWLEQYALDEETLSICEDPKKLKLYLKEIRKYAEKCQRGRSVELLPSEARGNASFCLKYVHEVIMGIERYTQELLTHKELIISKLKP